MPAYRRIITIDPQRRFGKPCIRRTRITVGDVLEYMASGMMQKEILSDFPELTNDDLLACFAFATAQERRNALTSPGNARGYSSTTTSPTDSSPGLIAELTDIYLDSLHVRNIGPEDAAGTDIWDYARDHRLDIVTKDSDYREMTLVGGHGPKVVLITLRNCPTTRVPALLRQLQSDLISLQQKDYKAVLDVGTLAV